MKSLHGHVMQLCFYGMEPGLKAYYPEHLHKKMLHCKDNPKMPIRKITGGSIRLLKLKTELSGFSRYM